MSCTPLSLVTDYGELSSANATSAVTGAKTIKTGVVYVVCSDAKAAGHIAVCNTANQAGVGSFHVAKGDSFLYRYGHPARGTVTSAAKGTSTVLTLNHPDSKIRVGDYVTMSGADVGAWNSLIAHVPVTAVSSPQQWNDYQQTVTVTANSSALADFTGSAFIEKSVIFRLAPETASGCTLHLHEVGIG
tara:strand:+ start:156 stop:719 length:564 start_codon:yes stop_codon:yes gene_type:complete